MKPMDCCSTKSAKNAAESPAQDGPREACGACRAPGRPVGRKTVLLMLKPELLERAAEGEYRFCPDPDCRVVYFAGGGLSFSTADLRVRVGLKEKEDPVPLCYCFGFDERDVREEIAREGRSSVPERISALIKQGMCACPERNPSGACCLGEVNRAVKRLMAAAAEAPQAGVTVEGVVP